MLTVFFESLIAFFKVAGTVLPNLVGGLNKVILEDAVASGRCLALVSVFVRASALLAAWNDSRVGA